jgi:hypothetical protein
MPDQRADLQFLLECPCGEELYGDTEDDIVETAFAHLREKHPAMADGYERHHVLFMARRVPK